MQQSVLNESRDYNREFNDALMAPRILFLRIPPHYGLKSRHKSDVIFLTAVKEQSPARWLTAPLPCVCCLMDNWWGEGQCSGLFLYQTQAPQKFSKRGLINVKRVACSVKALMQITACAVLYYTAQRRSEKTKMIQLGRKKGVWGTLVHALGFTWI